MTVACVSRKTKPGARRKLVLDQFAPYRIVALGHAISGRLARAYRDENITIPEWRVLAVIGEANEVAARDVVKRTPMDKMTVSRAVASLEQKGFVKRAPHKDDRRVSMLSLAPEGQDVFDRIAELALAFEDDLMSTLEPEEAAAFRLALEKLEEKARLNGQVE
ncbi:MarR family winged helix-turn-helix transcriptional regulator [Hyphococcus luteus]|uniref:MarR family transcriptional regulator n=1 Tax=Hyphococcus luteus TaxID=2058213 RepID=A0A2S7K961_9PROT|nr:MarR family transcriptional regulator [Marinicaulis flavus]PQA89054.1 MarR family transcriptional regulator [Marinicaulis flavus]